MSGIPGTVGASPVQNIGAYGQEIQETLVEVELIDESTGEVSTVPAAELGLGFPHPPSSSTTTAACRCDVP